MFNSEENAFMGQRYVYSLEKWSVLVEKYVQMYEDFVSALYSFINWSQLMSPSCWSHMHWSPCTDSSNPTRVKKEEIVLMNEMNCQHSYYIGVASFEQQGAL